MGVVLARLTIRQAKTPGYFHSAHLELAYFGLGDTLRGEKRYAEAAAAFNDAAALPDVSPELKQRCFLLAGKSYDLMGDRSRAVGSYQLALNIGEDTVQGQEARKWMKRPYTAA